MKLKTPVCYLFGAGEYYGLPVVVNPCDFVIAVDGGLDYLKECHMEPDLIIGDFDSVKVSPTTESNVRFLPREKDNTDMAAALQEGWNRGFRSFHVFGGTGARLDHTLANIQCITDIARKGGRGFLHDRETIITAIANGSIAFPADAQGVISVFCHSDSATGVTEHGLKYTLNDAVMHNTEPLGISNEFTGIPSRVSVREGTIVVIYSIDIKEIEE